MPLPGDHGAHGAFDERASSFRPQLWLNKNGGWLLLATGAGVACAMLMAGNARHGNIDPSRRCPPK
jgi:hypothetical protein